ncbi:MAG: hypothetical protein F6K61_19660 [Sphaerospermopsis sp. SIO1G1]|nr:hypothetical protein [Sphaerospermopsis sp. SIO1G1]
MAKYKPSCVATFRKIFAAALASADINLLSYLNVDIGQAKKLFPHL